jgi:prepilin-type N-terminal cleavage/methylation domain-containing protein
MTHRKAFTLIEVLISIALMGIVLIGLFSSLDILQDSNQHLSKQLEKTKKSTEATQVIYKDILSSDGNLTISKDEFSRLCMESTAHSLYALPCPKVCWLVLKENNTLVRVEGIEYTLPTRYEDRVEIDRVMENIELFDTYHEKDKVLVVLKERSKKAIKFMVQGVSMPQVAEKTDNEGQGPSSEGSALPAINDPVSNTPLN